MVNKKRKKIITLTAIAVVFMSFLFSCSAFADTKSSVLQKALMQGLYRCYTTGAVSKDAGKLSSFRNFGNLIIGGKSNNYVALPVGLTNITDNNISCKGLFLGDGTGIGTESGTFDGLFKLFGKSEYVGNITDDSKKITLLKGMGYSPSSSADADAKQCLYYVYDYFDGQDMEAVTERVCASGKTLSVEETNDKCTDPDNYWCHAPLYFRTDGQKLEMNAVIDSTDAMGTLKDIDYSDYSGNWDKFKNDLNKMVTENFSTIHDVPSMVFKFSSNKSEKTQNTTGNDSYSIKSMSDAAVAAINFLNSNYKSYNSIAFTKQERLWYYEHVLTNWFYKGKSTNDYYKCGIAENPSLYSNYEIIHIDPSTGARNKKGDCGVNKDATISDTKVQGFGRGYHFQSDGTSGTVDLKAAVNAINLLVGELKDEELPESAASQSAAAPEPEKTCTNSGGAANLGWIVCSILDWMGNATDDLYKNFIEPNLRVESSFFDDGKAAQQAWESFRDIANILFTILILVVVFSQLTGYGIDNYGIKKILPKLIIAAVLINLSYLICVICVDLSNIAGNGLQQFFNGFSFSAPTITIPYPAGQSGSDPFNTNVAADVGVVSVGLATTAVGLYAIFANPALLLTLLVSMLGLLISMLFMFILLAGRKAVIIVLAVVSPIMFLLYILPNTKKIFDKWLNLWKAMLLLYPICGLLIGGGNFASRLVLSVGGSSNGGAAIIFTALVIGILPIFFVPMVLKSAFAALGSIGSKISGWGDKMSSGATNKIRKTEGYKNAQKMGLERKIRKQAGLNKQGDLTMLGRGKSRFARSPIGRFIGADTRLAAKNAAVQKNIKEQEEAGAVLMSNLAKVDMPKAADIIGADGRSLFSGQRERYYAAEFLKAVGSKDRKKMNAALSAAKSAGVKDKDIAKMVRHAENSGAFAGMNSNTKSIWFQEQASKNGAFAKDVEMQHWASSGANGSLGNYGEYGRSHMDATDLDKSKLGNAGAESMAGLIQAGLVGKGLAEETLSDDSMSLSPEKSIMLGAVKDGKLSGNGTAAQLKEDAVSLSGGGTAANGTILPDEGDVEKWTAPPAERVTVDQQEINKVPVRVTGAAAENQVFDVRSLSTETLEDMATNPNVSNNDPTRMAAELELYRRNDVNNHGPENS